MKLRSALMLALAICCTMVANATATDGVVIPESKILVVADLQVSSLEPNEAVVSCCDCYNWSLPNVFGGSLQTGETSFFNGNSGSFEFALAGPARVADNNLTLPTNRIYLHHQHFENGLDSDITAIIGTAVRRRYSDDVDVLTVGIERTFCCDLMSIELRLPLLSADISRHGSTQGSSDDIRNVTAIVKSVLWSNECSALSAGVGVTIPVADELFRFESGPDRIFASNETVGYSPFVSYAALWGECSFVQSFVQLGLPSEGETIAVNTGATSNQASWRQQATLSIDLSTGTWLFRNPCAAHVTGVAGLVELNYTTALSGSDRVVILPVFGTVIDANMGGGRFDDLRFTLGLHAELANHSICRIGVGLPLSDGQSKTFETALSLSIERRR